MKHRLLSMILSAALILSLSACSTSSSSDTNKEQQEDSSSGLAIFSKAGSQIDGVVSQFKTLHPEIKIQDERYFDDDEGTGGIKQKAITELMTGEGPDVLVLEEKDFPNLHKMLENNIFYDLNTLMDNDSSFKRGDYNKIAMDSGVYEGKQAFVPLYFRIPLLITTKSFFLDQQFNIPKDGISWEDLSQMAKKFLSNPNNNGKYLFSSNYSFENLIQGSYMQYIDYSERKSSFDSNEFINLLKICKELQPTVCPVEDSKNVFGDKLVIDGKVGITHDRKAMELQSLSIGYSIFKQYLKEDMYLIPFPGNGDAKKVDIPADVGVIAGINVNCKKPKEAFKFLKLLLEKTNQTRYNKLAGDLYIRGAAVNTAAWKEELGHWMSSEVGGVAGTAYDDNGSTIDYVSSALSSNVGEELDKLYNGITKAQINDYNVLTILTEETKAFLSGKATAEQTAKAINDKVMLYLNE